MLFYSNPLLLLLNVTSIEAILEYLEKDRINRNVHYVQRYLEDSRSIVQ